MRDAVFAEGVEQGEICLFEAVRRVYEDECSAESVEVSIKLSLGFSLKRGFTLDGRDVLLPIE